MIAPNGEGPVPLAPKLERLPLSQLTWENFERLLARVLRDVEGLRGVTVYGNRGQSQHGLDVVGRDTQGDWVGAQTKRQEAFSEGDHAAAVNKFANGKRPFAVTRFIVAVSCDAHSTEIVQATRKATEQLQPVDFEFWDAEHISTVLRNRPMIVIEFFGEQTAALFCTPWQRQIIPGADAAEVAEAVSRSPVVATGAAALLGEAEELASEDPSRGAQLVAEAQVLLREARFPGHADSLELKRIALLSGAGEWKGATDATLEAFWSALYADAGHLVYKCRQQVESLVSDFRRDETESALAIIGMATMIYEDPRGGIPSAFKLPDGARLVDEARLLALAGEAAIADGQVDWVSPLADVLTVAAKGVSSLAGSELLRTRLLILAAEGTDTAEGWHDLLDNARRYKDGYASSALVHARYARWSALRDQPQLADAEWEEATRDACLARRWPDGSRWVLARRVFTARWHGPVRDEDLLTLQLSIARMGDAPPLVGTGKDHAESCLESLRRGKLREAAISAQRQLREACTSADWYHEQQALRLLAEVMRRSGELRAAAEYAIRAADTTEALEIVKAAGENYVDITDQIDAPSQWSKATAFRAIAAEADLVPDAQVTGIVDSAIATVESFGAGKLLHGLVGPNILQESIRALGSLGERLTSDAADKTLTYFESQPQLDDSHYRFHDDSEATAVARIANSHAALRKRALDHLVLLCARSQTARTAPSVAESMDAYSGELKERLRMLADTGSHWAAQQLALSEPPSPEDANVERARRRFLHPLEHPPGTFTMSGGIIEDSLLLIALPPFDRIELIRACLVRARDPMVFSNERGQYLVAASNLVDGLEVETRRHLFEEAMQNITDPAPSEADDLNRQFTHPLGLFRVSAADDCDGEAVYLCARLTDDPDQEERVNVAAKTVLASHPNNMYAAKALSLLPATDVEVADFARSPNSTLRMIAAYHWGKTSRPPHVGTLLARDADANVRRALAAGVADLDESESKQEVRDLLLHDARHSVRALVAASMDDQGQTSDQPQGG